jgi:hypothetical protein
VATYIYAIVGAEHPLRLDGTAGVGEPAQEIRVLRADRLAAVASDVPEGLRAKRRDVLAHQRVLDRLLQDGAVLPMRFGLVAPDDEQAVAAIAADTDRYTERLAELDGCREYNLKVTRDEDDLLRQIVAEVPEARRLNELTRAEPGDPGRKVALGELLAVETRNRQEHDAVGIIAGLEPRAAGRSDAKPTAACFLNTSFLVSEDRAEEFVRAVEDEADRRGTGYAFTLNGPLPPYSFV